MMLPNLENEYISQRKLEAYLLSETHPVGGAKARVLRSAGIDETKADELEQGWVMIAHSQEVKETLSSPHGVEYVIDGGIIAPSGDLIQLRTVWIIDMDHDRPRFVTAYPA